MDFDPNTALQYAVSIARPRQVGSGEDEKVADEIADRLRSFGYQVDRQPFAFSIAPQLFTSLEILIGLLLAAAIFASPDRSKILPAILLLMWVFVANPINQAVRSRSVRLNNTGALNKDWFLKTTNLIARLSGESMSNLAEGSRLIGGSSAQPPQGVPHLYLVAHYDSKSQRLPLVLRIALFVIAIFGGVAFALLTLFQIILGQSILLADVIGILAFLSGLPLLLLDINNDSPGAIDNASSVGLVLHLAECLRDVPCALTILITSGEELSLMGSTAYVQQHATQLDREQDQIHILNFDGIGVDGDLRLIAPRRAKIGLRQWIEAACQELKLPLGRFNLVGALYDHMPFAERGLDAVTLIAIGQASRSIHTAQDSIDKLHVRGFDQAGRVALSVIQKLTTDYTDVTDKTK